MLADTRYNCVLCVLQLCAVCAAVYGQDARLDSVANEPLLIHCWS